MTCLTWLLVQVTMSGDWVPWSAKVPQVEVETHKVGSQSRARLFKITFTGTESSYALKASCKP
jgi:hypothetical protein